MTREGTSERGDGSEWKNVTRSVLRTTINVMVVVVAVARSMFCNGGCSHQTLIFRIPPPQREPLRQPTGIIHRTAVRTLYWYTPYYQVLNTWYNKKRTISANIGIV